jgi:A/G-specific adenine glycosylase
MAVSRSPRLSNSVDADSRGVAALRRRLLAWYSRHARALPWRATRDPYAIWVSEVMLQQTQVATVIPYYHRFLERFPTVESLASAPIDRVLASWAGLGYYRRARSLHEAAGFVVREHAGRIPCVPDAFSQLPGVGRYTAGAVLSIAFDRKTPVLDGNVARVLSRVFGLELGVRDPRQARALWELADALVPMRTPGDWNQALMELGATVCLPKSPRCEVCPVAKECRARIEDRVDHLPPVAKRRAAVAARRAVALLEWRGRWLVERRSGRLLDGLWEPPGVELSNGDDAGAALRRRLRSLGVAARLEDSGERVKHVITHRRIEVEVWRGRLDAAPRRRAGLRGVRRGEDDVALTALAKRLLG